MSGYTLQLPAGTNQIEMINFPTSGSWLGAAVFSIATRTNCTIHYLVAIAEFGATKWYRRVGPDPQVDWTLNARTRPYWFAYKNESMLEIKYTSTTGISLNIETNKSDFPPAHPQVAADQGGWNGQIYSSFPS